MEDKEKLREEQLKKIVLMNLETMPLNFSLSIGNEGFFDRDQLIDHVNKSDHIGKQIMEAEFRFMKALSNGEITKALASI